MQHIDTNVSHYPICDLILAAMYTAHHSTSGSSLEKLFVNGIRAHYRSLLEAAGLFTLYDRGRRNDKVQLISTIPKYIKLLIIFCQCWFIVLSVCAES